MSALLTWLEGWPRWVLMWSFAFAVYAGLKLLTFAAARPGQASWGRRLGYLLGWPGLDATAFLGPRTAAPPALREWLFAAAKTAFGAACFFLLGRQVPATQSILIVGWLGMVGLIFMLHFGLFHLLSCAWRQAGVQAKPLMAWPVAAPGLGDFWGKRWNLAFRDVTHRFVFRPLVRRFGPAPAMAAVFLASGLVHDAVISPASGGGYGGPTLYFLLQGAAFFFERAALGRQWGLGRGLRGWAFTALMVIGPLGLLFHPPFIHAVILPMMRGLGALP